MDSQIGLPLSEKKHLSVTELTLRIRGVVEPAFQNVWVQGEISNYRPASSGHAYFSLKDEGSMLAAAIFGWGSMRTKGRFKFDLKDGLQVICRGRVTLYPPRGSYQLTIDHIEPVGSGALQQQFEELKNRLASEGLFDQSRKRSIPEFPKTVAVVTSPTGAAIQDMLNILKRRAPQIAVRIVPALVQGEGAAAQITAGLEMAQKLRLGDVIVLARGGGSIEDLWAFNDERLARAISASSIPVLSAVGHEIDFTISDFVSDLRAPTPSAAAELISGHWVDVRSRLLEQRQRLFQTIRQGMATRRLTLNHLSSRVISPRDRLREQAQRCDEWTLRLERSLRFIFEQRKARLAQYQGKLEALSPLRVLDRGYAIVHDPSQNNLVVRSVADVKSGMTLRVRFKDGSKDTIAK